MTACRASPPPAQAPNPTSTGTGCAGRMLPLVLLLAALTTTTALPLSPAQAPMHAALLPEVSVLHPSFDVRSYTNLTAIDHLHVLNVRPRALRRHLERPSIAQHQHKRERPRTRKRSRGGASGPGLAAEDDLKAQRHWEVGMAQLVRYADGADDPAQASDTEAQAEAEAEAAGGSGGDGSSWAPAGDSGAEADSARAGSSDGMDTGASTKPADDAQASAPDKPNPNTDVSQHRRRRVPVFSETAAELVQAELEYVRNKYANAMKVLYGAPLAAVDVAVGYPALLTGDNDADAEGDGVKGRVTLLPGENAVNPMPGAPAVPASAPSSTWSPSDPVQPPASGLWPVAQSPNPSGGGGIMESMPADGTPAAPAAPVALMPVSGVEGSVQPPSVPASESKRSWGEVLAGLKAWLGGDGVAETATNQKGTDHYAGSPAHSDMVKRSDSFSSNAVPLKSYIQGSMDVLYYGELGIGTPTQVLTVDFDTGSADLWLPARCGDCRTAQFDDTKSSTLRETGKKFEVEYGSGSVSGRLVADTVRLGSTVVEDQFFGAIDTESADFTDSPHAGLMGMAFSSIASSGEKTYFERLIDQGSVKVPIFSFYLTRKRPEGSQLCIGCYDSSKFTGGFTWLPVVSKTYWSVSMTGFSAKGPGVNALTQTLIGAIDTGTTLIYVPPRVATQFYAQIPGAEPASQYGEGFYQYPCSADADIRLNIGLNNRGFGWNAKDFNLGRTARGSSMCVGAILGVSDGFPDDLAIIGDVFLKSWYTIFDQSQNSRVGFASSINNA